MIPIVWLAVCLAFDLRWRWLPHAVVLAGLAVGIIFTDWSWWGFVVALIAMLVAGFPGGDAKALAVLGGMIGLLPILCVLSGSFLLTLAVWRMHTILFPWILIPAITYPLYLILRVFTGL